MYLFSKLMFVVWIALFVPFLEALRSGAQTRAVLFGAALILWLVVSGVVRRVERLQKNADRHKRVDTFKLPLE